VKLIFAGTPPFAAAALRALHVAGHKVALVLTQPDRPAGRGMKLTPSAVAVEAGRLGLRLEKPPTLKDPAAAARVRDISPDVMVVAAYGMLLPQDILDIPRHGCLNIHGSLLPRWRGAAPVQRAIEAGDSVSGITIMQMDKGLDTGAILLERPVAIEADETSTSLFAKLTAVGCEAIVDALASLATLKPRPQPDSGATYAKKIEKSEARIDWTRPADEIERRLRAFDPFPGGESLLGEEVVKVWRGEVVAGDTALGVGVMPGTILAASPGNLIVTCGQQALRLQVLQKRGGKRMSADDFLRGSAVCAGMVFA
jgi:methionyl-tRNA formyltransferase